MLMAVALSVLCASGQVSFEGNTSDVMDITPDNKTGLNKIYVLDGVEGVSMVYTATTMNPVTWYLYGEQGGGYAQEIFDVVDDRENPYRSYVKQVQAEHGYIIEEGTTRTYIWVTDYSRYPLQLNSLAVDNDGDCGTATLHLDGSGADIPYYTITGVKRVLSRELKLNYFNLEWDDETHYDEQLPVTEIIEGVKPTIVIPAPFCNTTFTLTGDRFLEFWGKEQPSVESDIYVTKAVEVHAVVEQEERNNDNEKKTPGSTDLGGSAPAHITFTAYYTDAVVHKEWQMALDQDFENIQLRINQDVVDETFIEEGTYYWRFIGSNADGTCEYPSDVYTVNIGVSELDCPNVFAPGSGREWKVSYRSITEFKCAIFNRWGNCMIEFNDPGQGWDGTYHGKEVPAGVYYYVINAYGSDGKHYKLSGDINIIRHKRVVRGSEDPSTVVDPDNPGDPGTGE